MATAILLAGGKGDRMRSDLPKQFLDLHGRPVLLYSLETFYRHPRIERIVLVIHPEFRVRVERLLVDANLQPFVHLVDGGAMRQKSVANGLSAIDDQEGDVLIHDCARPLVPSSLVSSCLDALAVWPAVVPALPMIDTLYRTRNDDKLAPGSADPVSAIPMLDRSRYRLAQTPQGFRLSLIRQAHALADDRNILSSFDDGSLVHHFQLAEVMLIPGHAQNIKITYIEDLLLAESILKQRGQAHG